MKRIKSFKIFENFDLGREEIIDFFEDLDLVDIKSVEVKSVSDFTEEYKKRIKLVSYYIKDLFSGASSESNRRDFIYDYLNYKTGKLDHILGRSNEQMMVVSLDFYHPKMIRNSSFQYENYIRETLKSRLQRVRDGYDMDVFMYIEGGVNYMSDPIAKVQLFLFNQE